MKIQQEASQRSFMQRMQEPDPEFANFLRMLTHVVPLSIGFLPLGLLAIQILLTAALGASAALTLAWGQLVWFVSRCAAPAVAISFLGLWLLRGRVALKLRRSRQKAEAS